MGVRGSCTLFSYFPFEIFYNIKGPRKQEFSTPIFHSPGEFRTGLVTVHSSLKRLPFEA